MNIVTLFLALSILVAIILICFSDRKKVKQFDERQLIVRGRAVNLAYVTLLICLFIVLALSTMNLPWLDVPVCVILSMFISLTIFSVYAILNNAYFTNFKKETPFSGVFLSVSLLNLFNGFRHLFNGTAEDSFDIILPVAFGVLGVIIIIALFIRKRMDKKELEEEMQEEEDVEVAVAAGEEAVFVARPAQSTLLHGECEQRLQGRHDVGEEIPERHRGAQKTEG